MTFTNQTWKVFALLSVFVLSSCGNFPIPRYLTPFEDRPDERILFSHEVVTIEGTVWSFENDGSAVNYGGAIGVMYNEDNVRVVAADFPGISLKTGRDAFRADPNLVAPLIKAAHQFCDQTYGGQNARYGAAIYADGDVVLFVDHCQATRK